MAKLLTIKHIDFKTQMDACFDEDQEITSADIFDTFVHALHKATNVLNEEDLKVLVFKQFKSYGDFDKTMRDVAQNVSHIHQSTKDAITAIDSNDTSALKNAYTQLKDYQKRIHELEEDIYTDDITGMYNRKFLFNHELDEKDAFKYDGILMHLCVKNFQEINKEHGHEAGDVVLKFVSKMLQKDLKSMGVHLIRYMGVQFVCVAKENVSAKVQSVFRDSVDLILSKKFKTHEGEVLNIELELQQRLFRKGQSFQEVYENI